MVYTSYAALAAAEVEGVDYTRTAVTVSGAPWSAIAIHGGGIEGGSGEIAREVASSDFSYYQFAGTKSSGNSGLHITSSLFDEPRALALVAASPRTLSFHGFTGTAGVKETAVGGLDATSTARVTASLQEAGFTVITASTEVAGTDPLNICNRNSRNAGVQLELSNAQRAAFFVGGSTNAASRNGPTTSAFSAYAAAVRAATGPLLFTTPTVDDPLETDHPLFSRFRLARGITILVSGSTVVEAQYPNQEDLGDYDYVYLGGRIHRITDAEAATLTAAGYGAYIT